MVPCLSANCPIIFVVRREFCRLATVRRLVAFFSPYFRYGAVRIRSGSCDLMGFRVLMWLLLASLLELSTVSDALADLIVHVDLSEQEMVVSREGELLHAWSVSTGNGDYRTPRGSFRPTRMHEIWHSIKYDRIPMPSSIFFFKGYAIHGTLDIRDLGRPASRGCVRLHPENAKVLFDIVAEQGMSRTRIIIED